MDSDLKSRADDGTADEAERLSSLRSMELSILRDLVGEWWHLLRSLQTIWTRPANSG